MPADGVAVTEAFRVLDLSGVFANALLGGLIARREKFDPIGFATLAVLSGLGGGLLRDTLLQSGTPAALTDYRYLLIALVGAAISFLVNVEGVTWSRVWPVVDAVALGCWATAGAQKALAVGLGLVPAVLLGVITAVGGGAIRDVVLRRVPGILGGNTLYATAAFAGAGVLVVLSSRGFMTQGAIAGSVVGAGLCLIARSRGWILPNADAWSPGRVVPARYRSELRRRIKLQRRASSTTPARQAGSASMSPGEGSEPD